MYSASAPTIYLHIGAHKTGTTAFQHFMHVNRARAAEAGLHYPRLHAHREAHYRLAWSLRGMRDITVGDTPDFRTQHARLHAAIAAHPAPRILLSCEEFFALSRDAIASLSLGLAGYDVRIVAVVRRPDEFFASIHDQRVKPVRGPFADDHRSYLADPARLSPDLRYDLACARWASVFGRKAITVLLLEDGDIVDRLARHFGLDPTAGFDRDNRRANQRSSVRLAEAIRRGKQMGLELTVMTAIRDLGAERLPVLPEESLLAPEERLAILRWADPVTDQLFERHVGGPNRYRSDRFDPADFPPQTRLAEDDWLALLDAARQHAAQAPTG